MGGNGEKTDEKENSPSIFHQTCCPISLNWRWPLDPQGFSISFTHEDIEATHCFALCVNGWQTREAEVSAALSTCFSDANFQAVDEDETLDELLQSTTRIMITKTKTLGCRTKILIFKNFKKNEISFSTRRNWMYQRQRVLVRKKGSCKECT